MGSMLLLPSGSVPWSMNVPLMGSRVLLANERLALSDELQGCLEARLAQLICLADPVLIASAVVVPDLLSLASPPSFTRGRDTGSGGSLPLAMVRERRLRVHTFLGHISAPWRPSSEAADVTNRCAAGRSPWVMPVDILG